LKKQSKTRRIGSLTFKTDAKHRTLLPLSKGGVGNIIDERSVMHSSAMTASRGGIALKRVEGPTEKFQHRGSIPLGSIPALAAMQGRVFFFYLAF